MYEAIYKQLVYDGEVSDEDNLLTIRLSSTVLPWVRAAVERLLDPEAWTADSDRGAATSQVSDILSRLTVDQLSDISMDTYNYWFEPGALDNTGTAGYTFVNNGSQYTGGYAYQQQPENNAYFGKLRVWLPVGTFYIIVFYVKLTNCGNLVLTLDGDNLNNDGAIDMYAATVAFNQTYAGYGDIDEAGMHEIGLYISGKNASSTNYYCILSAIGIVSFPA